MSHARLLCLGLLAVAPFVAAASAHAAAPPPLVQLPNLQMSEGDAGSGPLMVNVALDRPNPYSVPVSVVVHDTATRARRRRRDYGTATPGVDYAGSPVPAVVGSGPADRDASP